jgi:hypothetical protein
MLNHLPALVSGYVKLFLKKNTEQPIRTYKADVAKLNVTRRSNHQDVFGTGDNHLRAAFINVEALWGQILPSLS